jgi:hypothetical protein
MRQILAAPGDAVGIDIDAPQARLRRQAEVSRNTSAAAAEVENIVKILECL